jgi:hypothetical protein
VKQVEIYRTWFEQNVLGPNLESTLDIILVLPWTAGFANYRDTPKPYALNPGVYFLSSADGSRVPNESFGHGFWSSYITSFTTGPELVFPSKSCTSELFKY